MGVRGRCHSLLRLFICFEKIFHRGVLPRLDLKLFCFVCHHNKLSKHGYIFYFLICLYQVEIMEPFLFRHEGLSLASLSAVPHVSSNFLKSPSKVFLRVIFVLPCFLLPGGFLLNPFFGNPFLFLLKNYLI